MAKLELDSRPALLRKLKQAKVRIKPGLATGPRRTLHGEPVTPNTIAGVTRGKRPTVSQLGNALQGVGLWLPWLMRLSEREPARYQALVQAWQQSGDAGLRGCVYVSDNPCRKCQCIIRTARTGECYECRKPVRFNADRKLSAAELRARDDRRYQREAAEELAGTPDYIVGKHQGWFAVSNVADTIRYYHPEKTQRVLRELKPVELAAFIRTDSEFRSLFLHLTENQPLPVGYHVIQQ